MERSIDDVPTKALLASALILAAFSLLSSVSSARVSLKSSGEGTEEGGVVSPPVEETSASLIADGRTQVSAGKSLEDLNADEWEKSRNTGTADGRQTATCPPDCVPITSPPQSELKVIVGNYTPRETSRSLCNRSPEKSQKFVGSLPTRPILIVTNTQSTSGSGGCRHVGVKGKDIM